MFHCYNYYCLSQLILYQGQFFHINSCNEMYVGGFKEENTLKKLTGIDSNFTGCIRKLHINGKPVDLRTKVHHGQTLHSWNIGMETFVVDR